MKAQLRDHGALRIERRGSVSGAGRYSMDHCAVDKCFRSGVVKWKIATYPATIRKLPNGELDPKGAIYCTKCSNAMLAAWDDALAGFPEQERVAA